MSKELAKATRPQGPDKSLSPGIKSQPPPLPSIDLPSFAAAHAGIGNAALASQAAKFTPDGGLSQPIQLQSQFGNAAMQYADLGGATPALSAAPAPAFEQISENGQAFNPPKSFIFPAGYSPGLPAFDQSSAPAVNQSQLQSTMPEAPYLAQAAFMPFGLMPFFSPALSESWLSLVPPQSEQILAGREKTEELKAEAQAKEQADKQQEKEAKTEKKETEDKKMEEAAPLITAATPGAASQAEPEPTEKEKEKKGTKAAEAVIEAPPKPAEGGAAGAEKAVAGGGGIGAAGPELAEWEGKVSQKTKAIKADGVEGVGRAASKRIQASGAAAVARAAEERRKQQEGAGDILPNPPAIPDPLLPPSHDPVPAATDRVRKASEQKIPNQTMPTLLKTKGNVMPEPPRSSLAPELGTKASTAYGKELEELDAQEKAATESKNKKELKRIKKARKALETKFKADWAEGKAEPMTLVEEEAPPPSPPLTEQTQADIGKVLAALTLMQQTATQELVDQARSVTYPNEVLREPEFDDFGKEGLDIAGTYLTNMIGEIGKAANLKKEDIDRYVAERKVALEQKTELVHGGLTDAAAFEKKKIQDLRQKQANEGAGVPPKVEEHVGRLASEFKVGTDPKIVREKRDQLVTAVSRKQGQQTGGYERAGERRQQALDQTHNAYLETYKNAVQTERSGYFKTAWKARKNKAKEKAAAEAEAETLLAPTVSWLRDELVPGLDAAFTRLKKQAADAITDFIGRLKEAAKSAIEMIADWADELTGNIGKSWFDTTEEEKDWEIQAKESAKAWEAQRATAARDALVQDINTMRMVTRYEEEELKQQQKAGAKKLTTQGDKTTQDAINSPAGPKDAILTVATQLKQRLFGEERPKIVEKFEKKFEDLGPDRWHEVDAVAQVVEPGGQTADWIGDKVRDATDRIGTDEDKIYNALANLTPIRARAVRLYYRNEYDSDIESVLKGELSGAEEDRALGLLNRDPGKADAATIVYAINPAFQGSGDVSAVMNILSATKDPADLRAKFKAEYGYDLDEYLRHSLTGANFERAQEFLTGDQTTRYVTELKHSVRSEDRKGVETVYAKIRADVEQEAAKQSEKVRSGLADPKEREWDSKRIEEEVKKRSAEVEKAYNEKEEKTAGIFASTLSEDIDRNFKGPERDLALAIKDGNVSQANAARLKMEDKGVEITYGFTGPKLKTPDSKAINGILAAGGERARLDVQRDEEIKLWNKNVEFAREQQVAYLRGWSPQKIDEQFGEKARQDFQKKAREDYEKNVKTETEKRALEYKNELDKSYRTNYGSGIQEMVDRNVFGEQHGKAKHLIEQGGILTKSQTLHYAVVEKDADTVKSILGSTSEDEMKDIKKEWRDSEEGKKWLAEHDKEGADDFILSKFDGDDKFDIKLDITGKSDDPEKMLARKEAKLKRQETQYGLASGDAYEGLDIVAPGLGGKDYELRRLRREVARLRSQVDHLKTLPPGSDAYKFAKRSYERQLGYVDRATESHRTAVDRRTNDMAMIVGIVVTAIVIVATGGAATPLLAALAAGAGAAASIITKAVMKGGAYIGTKEMWTDIVVGVVDTIVSAATAGLGAKLLKGIGPLAKMSQSTKLAPRLIAHGLAEGAENFVSSIPTSVAQQLMEKGDVSFSETFTGAAIGAGLGGVMGSIGGFKKPGIAGATSDILAHRGTPKQRLADWKLFQQANPEKTYKEFLAELDSGILSKQAKEAAEREAQRKMRRELFEYIPPAQRAQFKDVPIRRMSDPDFDRFTRSASGQAAVLVVNGKPQVILRETADISVLRREGKHLLQSVDPETAHLFRTLDEKKLAKWDRLSLDEQLGLYKTKVHLEIDAQQRTLKDLNRELTAAGADPAARKRVLSEIDEVHHTVDNLKKRAGEVESITAKERRAMRRDPTLRPDYLDQPARLFEKKSRLTIKQELVDAIRREGLDTSKANRVLERLRVAAEGAGPKRPFASVVKKMETLLKTDTKAAKAYLDDINSTIDNWIGDPRGGLAIVEASTKMKDPSAFLGAANKVTGIVEKGVKGKASDALDAIAGKVSRLEPAAAHKYLDELGGVLDAFSTKKPSELIGFLRATAGMDNSTSFTNKLKTFAANRTKAGVDLPEQTMKEIGDAMAALPPRKATKFVDALDDFTRSHTPDELKRFDGFIAGAPRAKSGDPVKYVADVKDLIAQKNHGLSGEALDVLAAKVNRGTLDVEWLVKTNIYKEKAAREFFDLAAKDINTPWNLYRAADRHPDVKFLQDRLRRPVRGLAGEYLTFLLGKELKEAGEILQDAAARKTMNILKRAGIDEVTGAQIEVITEKFGRSVIDVPVRSKLGPHGLEVKAYGTTYWEQILDAWQVKALNPYAVLNEAQAPAFFSMQRMLKQLNNANDHFKNPPFLLTSTAVDKISPRYRDILDDIIANEMPKGTKILTLPESDFEWAEKEIKRLFSGK